jgi:hypothetical protein
MPITGEYLTLYVLFWDSVSTCDLILCLCMPKRAEWGLWYYPRNKLPINSNERSWYRKYSYITSCIIINISAFIENIHRRVYHEMKRDITENFIETARYITIHKYRYSKIYQIPPKRRNVVVHLLSNRMPVFFFFDSAFQFFFHSRQGRVLFVAKVRQNIFSLANTTTRELFSILAMLTA